MRVEQGHELGHAEAIRRIDRFLDDLLTQGLPAGVVVRNPQKTWTGNRMDFAVNVSRGFFGTNISGTIVVADGTVVLEAELPGLVKTFVGEETVRGVIAREFARLLASGQQPANKQ